MIVRGTASQIAQDVKHDDFLESGSHNMLVYDSLKTLQGIFASYAQVFLAKNEIILFATQYIESENIDRAIRHLGVDVSKHLDDGTLFIIDAQKGYQTGDGLGNYKLAMSLISRARKERRRGVTWMGDMGSFFAFRKISDLVDYELSYPTTINSVLRAVCCYHSKDYASLAKNARDKLEQHHFKTIFAG